MLEYWYKERRTLADFRRGVLGEYFDGFAEYLKTSGFSSHCARDILGKCCQFNAFLIDQRITNANRITEAKVEAFLAVYLAGFRTTSEHSPKPVAKRALKHLFTYLVRIHVIKPARPIRVKGLHSWILDPYIQHLREECGFHQSTIQRSEMQVNAFLEALGKKAAPQRIRALTAETVQNYITQYLNESPENLSRLAGALRRFFRYCAGHGHTRTDFSGLIPAARRYRHASLPRGLEDSALDRVLKVIDKDTIIGARDYAIVVLMMAYGIRGISVAELLLNDIEWQTSRIRIRAQKGGKEVVLPLMEVVGDAIIKYLRHRFPKTSSREVFLTAKAPFRPLNSLSISRIVRHYFMKAGVQIPGAGSRTLRHSWAIRALGRDSSIKSIADVLGHRYIDTTFIYAKADLKALREVAMPWPKKGP